MTRADPAQNSSPERRLFPQFDKPFALPQPLQRIGPEWLEPRQQCPVGAVPFTNPNQSNRRLVHQPAIGKVLVLADDDCVLPPCVLPNVWIIPLEQGDVEDKGGLVAA